MNNILIIIPAFNEEGNIEKLFARLSEKSIKRYADVLVVNDASCDQTGVIAKSFDIQVITHIFNLGYGSALQVGYKYALRNNYEYVIQLDADGQHEVSNIPIIYEHLTKRDDEGNIPDIVIGSRFLKDSKSYKSSFLRRISISWFSWLIKKVTKKKITDPTSGLQGLNRKAFRYYSRFGNFDYNYPDANMIIQMLLLGFNIKEFPAIMYERTEGESMHKGLINQFVYMLIMPLSIWSVVVRIKRGLKKRGSKNIDCY